MKALLFSTMSNVLERFCVSNFKALEKLNFEIHAIAYFENEHDQEYAEILKEKGVIVYNIPFVRSSLIGNLRTLSQIRRILEENNFDLVHCHTETGGILMRLAMVKNHHTKYAFTPHGMSFYKGAPFKNQLLYKPLERWICSAMDANFAMNSEEFTVLKSWNRKTSCFIHGVGISLTSIQNLTVDVPKKKKELGIPIDATVIMSVGELNDNKNHNIVIDAISKLNNRDNLYYLICGVGANKESLLNQAESLGLKDRLILPGYRYDITEIFHIGDIFVFPSFHEGLSVSLMQAMASGMPIICSRIRGNVDLIHESNNGFLVNPKDSNSIAYYLEKLINDKKMRMQMGLCNKQIIEKYSLEHVEVDTLKIYKKLLYRNNI